MRCPEVVSVGWQEWVCGLTGVSVDPHCQPDGDGQCIPRLAREVKIGLHRLDDMPKDTRAAVQTTMGRLREGALAGGSEGKGMNLDEMSADQLEELAAQARARLRNRRRDERRAEKQRRTLLPRLQARLKDLLARREEITQECETLAQQIEELRAGRTVEPAKANTGAGRSRRAWTEEEIKRMRALRAEGRTWKEIGQALGRHWGSCASALGRQAAQ